MLVAASVCGTGGLLVAGAATAQYSLGVIARHCLPSGCPCFDNPVVNPNDGFACGCILAMADSCKESWLEFLFDCRHHVLHCLTKLAKWCVSSVEVARAPVATSCIPVHDVALCRTPQGMSECSIGMPLL